MKKIIVSLCLLYAANGCAMGAAKKLGMVALGATPAMVCGKYYHDETERVRAEWRDILKAEGSSPEEIEKKVNEVDSFRPYVFGAAVGGYFPPSNIMVCAMFATAHELIRLFEWANYEKVSPSSYQVVKEAIENDKHAVPKAVGAATGLTAATIALHGLKLLKKAK
jgi:hypothetical protein